MTGQGHCAWVAVTLVGCFSKPPAPAGSRDAGFEDGGADAGDAAVVTGVNYMFVTAETRTGTELGDPQMADNHCQDAAAGKLPGTFKAWVSTGGSVSPIHARARLGSARGWIRPDGRPFADTIESITLGAIYYPPRITESSQDLPNAEVFTGTAAEGDGTGGDCAAPGGLATIGYSDATTAQWTNTFSGVCGSAYHLYCFGVDHAVEVVPPPVPANAMRAFVTSEIEVSNRAEWTSHCAEEASASSVGGTFVPFVANTAEAARMLLSPNPVGWYRLDGVQIAENELFTEFRAPLNVTADRRYVIGHAYSGATTVTVKANNNSSCDNWTNPSSVNLHKTGEVQRSNGAAFGNGTDVSCQSNNRLYCFESRD